MNRTKKMVLCSNCGIYGHYIKSCIAPVTSYGCILLKLPESLNQASELTKNEKYVSGYESALKEIKFLMIQRRDSLGFIEIMRGKYKITDYNYIKYHVNSMTKEEHEKILSQDFDTLWLGLWGVPKEQSQNYKNDKEAAKEKFAVSLGLNILLRIEYSNCHHFIKCTKLR